MSILVKVLYFGQAREAAGTAEEELPLVDPGSVRDILKVATARHGRLSHLRGILRVAVNTELAPEGRRLRDGDTVALLPPVAGG